MQGTKVLPEAICGKSALGETLGRAPLECGKEVPRAQSPFGRARLRVERIGEFAQGPLELGRAGACVLKRIGHFAPEYPLTEYSLTLLFLYLASAPRNQHLGRVLHPTPYPLSRTPVQKSRGLCVPECGILEGVARPLRNEIRLGGFVRDN
jgi:hypothetical protein